MIFGYAGSSIPQGLYSSCSERGLLCWGFPCSSVGKESACSAGDLGSIPGSGRFPWRRKWQSTPVLFPGKSHAQKSLVGYSPWGHKESDTTERLHFHFPLSCTGEGNGNLLQCSCLENPRDRGASWAAVSGVVQSWTRLKRLSSSNCIPRGFPGWR